MTSESDKSGNDASKAGPQGTQAFSREQLAEVLNETAEHELPQSRRASLRVVSSDAGKQVFELNSDRMTIGRSGICDLRVEEPSISSEHARFVHAEDGWRIINLLSTNGVFVNDKKVFSHLLSDGDEIRLGRTVLRFHDPSGTGGGADRPGSSRRVALAVVAAVVIAAVAWWLL
ncbi:MAG: FHA domain-containing protein [Wenzhouxiangellaceae bacterium]